MAANCTNKYDLGCVDVCELAVAIPEATAPSTGQYTAVFQYLGREIIIVFEAVAGQPIEVPIASLNERFPHCFHLLDELGQQLTLNIAEVGYDCFKMRTVPSVAGVPYAPYLGGIECADLLNVEKGLTITQLLDCILPTYDFSDPATQAAVTAQQIIDLTAWLISDAAVTYLDYLGVSQPLATVPPNYEHYRISVRNNFGAQIEIDDGASLAWSDLVGHHSLDASSNGEFRLPRVVIDYVDAAGELQHFIQPISGWYSFGFEQPEEAHQRIGLDFPRIEIKKSTGANRGWVDVSQTEFNLSGVQIIDQNSDPIATVEDGDNYQVLVIDAIADGGITDPPTDTVIDDIFP